MLGGVRKKKSYSILVSVASDETSDLSPSFAAAQWLDLDLYAVGWSVCVPPKNLNRKWLYQCVSRGDGEFVMREKCTVLEWPGRPPSGFCTVGKCSQNANCTCTISGTV